MWVVAASGAAVLAAVVVLILIFLPQKPLSLTGVVLVEDSDPRKQAPIADASVTATAVQETSSATSDISGLFHLSIPTRRRHEKLSLRIEHPGYLPVDLTETADGELVVVRMRSSAPAETLSTRSAETVIANVRLRYSAKATTTTNIGAVVDTFAVENKANVPCGEVPPCSPDNRWKAAMQSYSVDAGERNELRNVRLSCIAGPCPFTRIVSETPSADQRRLTVLVLNWSDLATFLLEAEVSQTRISDVVRQSYPAIFGSTLSFTLPPGAEGPSIEAELNGNDIVFPLGPDLLVSWATCSVKTSEDQGNLFRCELKAGYRFK
jgi:hypothetical protein